MDEKRAVLAFLLMQFGSSVANELPPVCEKIFSVAASAVAQRAKGTPENAMREALPPVRDVENMQDSQQAQLLIAMHEILDEVYGGESLPAFLYATYRAELCVHEAANGSKLRKPFENIREDLVKCASLPEGQQTECAMMLSIPPRDP